MAEWADKLEGYTGNLPLISYGVSGAVIGLDDKTVLKNFIGGEERKLDEIIEREIYGRLGHHPSIVKCISMHHKGIILERLECCLRQRLIELRQRNELPTKGQILKWSRQVSEGIQYIHGKNVFQVDIGTHNILIDNQDNVKLCDFAGSSIDEGDSTVLPGGCEGYHLFFKKGTKPSIHTELFALGCAIFEMSTTWRPYHDKTDKEIKARYDAGEFPDTDNLILGPVMRKCWSFQYSSAAEVVDEIDKIIAEYSPSTNDGWSQEAAQEGEQMVKSSLEVSR
ncbi:hypothetical protein AYO20_11169 [Fonsecaea nubica]|uniref:Protein kinase domain-containing protein n=1 Tax=Fonsecaea nubica TaxID=856822 RepID=A0A178C1P0_9EURO|nr:hypothetical protein AYO20_11169 [Fonsecaea nubica]OAL22681.1 hypothetical protein AYO20_11169 [Fonsecaea nubica]